MHAVSPILDAVWLVPKIEQDMVLAEDPFGHFPRLSFEILQGEQLRGRRGGDASALEQRLAGIDVLIAMGHVAYEDVVLRSCWIDGACETFLTTIFLQLLERINKPMSSGVIQAESEDFYLGARPDENAVEV